MSTKGKELTPATRHNISVSKTKIKKSDLIKAGKEYLTQLQENEKQLPTITGYALYAGISKRHLYTLADKYPEVSHILELIINLQEEYALTRGITNRANPIFSMFLLKSKHNFRDNPQNVSQTNNFNISPDVLADAIQLMRSKKV
jgi:hypothetical protein